MQVPVASSASSDTHGGAPNDLNIPLTPSPTRGDAAGSGRLIGAVVQPPAGRCGGVHLAVQLPARQHGRQDRTGAGRRLHSRDEARTAGPARVIELAEIMDEVGSRGGGQRRTSSRPEPSVGCSPETSRHRHGQLHRLDRRRRAIYAAGAPTMKRLLLELGGKGAGLVLVGREHRRRRQRRSRSVWAFHTGQICTAPTRAIVHRSRYDELVARLAAHAPNLQGRRPRRRWTPSCRPGIDRYSGRRAARRERRATVRGRWAPRPRPTGLDTGFYVGPTLLAGCKQG